MHDIPIEQITQGKYQPRSHFDKESLEELAESIRAQGILQPLLVRETGEGQYEIVAGERRWRSAQLAGLRTVPAVVREIEDRAAMAVALVENIQRKDLNAVEMARGFRRLLEDFDLTHDQVSEVVGCSRSQITNLVRLLSLEEKTRNMLEAGKLDMGHARALLALPRETQHEAAQAIFSRGLSVRQAEALVKRLEKDAGGGGKKTPKLDQDIVSLVDSLSIRIGAKVDIKHGPRKGRLIIHYHSLDELDGIIERIK
ncbi:MAG: ParB/RepB/Spo0J family partition protein [Gammaproteobacteria bacterium]|nr:ParB/RepB/Spo0J family partition protein [Gammaproteobacteria bacterium]